MPDSKSIKGNYLLLRKKIAELLQQGKTTDEVRAILTSNWQQGYGVAQMVPYGTITLLISEVANSLANAGHYQPGQDTSFKARQAGEGLASSFDFTDSNSPREQVRRMFNELVVNGILDQSEVAGLMDYYDSAYPNDQPSEGVDQEFANIVKIATDPDPNVKKYYINQHKLSQESAANKVAQEQQYKLELGVAKIGED